MDHQTPMNANGTNVNGTEGPSAREVARSAADLWQHVLNLGELQLRLLAVELAEGLRQAKNACVVVVVGCVLALASLPVLLACLALVLAETTALTLAEAFAVVSVSAVLIACVLIAAGWRQLRKNAPGIPRSREELRENWRWLKDTSRGQHTSRVHAREPANGRRL